MIEDIEMREAQLVLVELEKQWDSVEKGIRSYLRQHILPRWRRIPVAEIKPKDLRDWLQSLDLSGATVRKIKAVIDAIFSFAVFEELASRIRQRDGS